MEMRILAFFHVFIVLSGFLFDIREPLSQDELAKRHRIVTLSPHLAEIVYASGAGDYVVGVMAGSNYPSGCDKASGCRWIQWDRF
jgi:ABC-type hemin transport system substrate-binding protein